MELIENSLDGQIALVALEGHSSSLFRHILHDEKGNERVSFPESCILVSSKPILGPKSRKQYFLMETHANSDDDRIKLHLLISSISALIVLNVTFDTDFGFLASLNGRCIASRRKERPLKENIASLLSLIHI